MNKVNLYALYDNRAETVVNVFISVNDVTAKRSFLDLISSPHPSLFTSHFDDFSLCKICSIEFNNLIFDSSQLVELIRGSEFSKAEILNMRLKAAEFSFPDNKELKEDILKHE